MNMVRWILNYESSQCAFISDYSSIQGSFPAVYQQQVVQCQGFWPYKLPSESTQLHKCIAFLSWVTPHALAIVTDYWSGTLQYRIFLQSAGIIEQTYQFNVRYPSFLFDSHRFQLVRKKWRTMYCTNAPKYTPSKTIYCYTSHVHIFRYTLIFKCYCIILLLWLFNSIEPHTINGLHGKAYTTIT